MQVYHVVKNMVEQSVWNKVFLLNLVRKLWRTDKSNTFFRALAPNVVVGSLPGLDTCDRH